MTFASSRRSFAALALAASLVLPVSASAAGPRPSPGPGGHGGGHHGSTSGGSQRSSLSRHQVSGTLAVLPLSMTVPTSLAAPSMTVPTSLTVLSGHTAIAVTVPATTTVVRGYGGRSSLDEFAVGDRVMAQGSFKPGSTTSFIARRIMDLSVKARSRVVGNVLSVATDSFTLRRGSQYSKPMTVTLTTSTTSALIVSGTVTLPPGALKSNMRVLVLGTYNRTQTTMQASRVRVLNARSARGRRGT